MQCYGEDTMSLQSNVTSWISAYNAVPFQTSQNPDYLGSILGTDDQFHTGIGLYKQPPASGLQYEIYDFNWYAGQGLTGAAGGKYLVHSENGLSWDTVNADTVGQFNFVTTGSLDTLYLGYNAIGDTGESPAEATLTTFNPYGPLLVINNFSTAIDHVAGLFGGTDGNSQILSSALVDSDGKSIITFPQYYEKVTLNSAIIYDLAFESAESDQSTFEYVLATYLKDISNGDITIDSDIADINTYLSDKSDLSFEYYPQAGSYAPDGEITTSAPVAETNSDLLLAA